MIYSTGADGLSVSYDSSGSGFGGYNSSGQYVDYYTDRSGNQNIYNDGGIVIKDTDSTTVTNAGTTVYNDGTTVYATGSSAIGIDLSSGVYGTATNIDATASQSLNILSGNQAANVIYGGSYYNFMWGGNDYANDILVGGTGNNYFICGKNEGSDTVLNASLYDKVLLYDVSLSDIVATTSDGFTVGLLFNTGNVLAVSGTSEYSADFQLSDGSIYWYDYGSQAWEQID